MFLTSVMNTRYGRGDKIRTCDFYVPNVALYQAEPHLDIAFLALSHSFNVSVLIGICAIPTARFCFILGLCVTTCVTKLEVLRSTNQLAVWYATLSHHFHMCRYIGAHRVDRNESQANAKNISTSRIIFANNVDIWRHI